MVGRSARDAIRVAGTRGPCVETVAEVVAVVADPAGTPVVTFGDVGASYPVRSTAKPLQAIPLLASGAAAGAGLDTAELALSCASHGGEDDHADRVAGWLARLGLDESALQCGPSLPGHPDLAARHLSAGGTASRLRHNCSGKHAGFLTLGAHLGADPARYLDPVGVVQRRVIEEVSSRCGVGDPLLAVDGCGAPVLCLTPAELARGLAAFTDPPADSPEHALRAAVSAHPWLVGGTGSADTALIVGSRDPETQSSRIIAKVGADGWHAAILADHVVVVKCRSGNQQPALVALVWVLAQLGAQCADLLPPPVIENDAGEPVGEYRVLS